MKKMSKVVCLLLVGVLCMTAVPTFAARPCKGEGIQTFGISPPMDQEVDR
ncbi:MAG: hypothetical protein ACRDDX_03835 [Cellulosilyticaceae bacterium]